jgi:uncharacterized membrane protein SirB2
MNTLAANYLHIKWLHVALVAASGTLFAARGAAVLAGQAWALRLPWRVASVLIDTALLGAGVTLWVVLQLNPATSPWLGVKLALLLVYIVLGSLALKRARTPGARRVTYAAALATFAFMLTVAHFHHPLGVLSR